MNDKEFIIYLCKQIFNIVVDGNEPDLDIIEKELKHRGINPDEVFIC